MEVMYLSIILHTYSYSICCSEITSSALVTTKTFTTYRDSSQLLRFTSLSLVLTSSFFDYTYKTEHTVNYEALRSDTTESSLVLARTLTTLHQRRHSVWKGSDT